MNFEIPEWLKYEFQKRLERFAIRERINRHQNAVLIAFVTSSLILIAVLIWIVIPQSRPPQIEDYKKEWYYDLNTDQLFTAKTGQIPPIDSPSGPLEDGTPAGVKAYVMTYNEEPNEVTRFIAYLEKFDPNDQDEISQLLKTKGEESKQAVRIWNKARLIKRVQDQQWFRADEPAGKYILKEAFKKDGQNRLPKYCPPD